MAFVHGSDSEEILEKKKPSNLSTWLVILNIVSIGYLIVVFHTTTPLTSILKKIRKLDKPIYITTPTGISTLVKNMEDVNLSSCLTLKDVLLVPDLKWNLVLIHKLTWFKLLCDLWSKFLHDTGSGLEEKDWIKWPAWRGLCVHKTTSTRLHGCR